MAREMRNSGISYFGEIPATWQVVRNGYLFCNTKTIVLPNKEYQLLSLSTKGVREKDINDTGGKVPENYNGYQIVHPKDMVMCLFDIDCSAVFSGLSNYYGMISPAYKILKCRSEIMPEYAQYVFSYIGGKRLYKQYSKNLRYTLNIDDFMALKLVLPPLPEQKAIADFLNAKCGEIDGLLADLDAEVKTLTEYKKSIIAETVTRGLNPNAPMKSSGIPWVGEIPKHWKLHPVYNYYTQRVHKNILGDEQNLLSLSYGKIIRKDINSIGGLIPASYNTYNIVEKNDIIIRPTDLQNDKRSLRTGLVTEHGIITSAYIALKPSSGVYSPFFHYLLHSYDVKKVFYNMGDGVRQGLNYSEFSRLMLIEPPIDEQIEIANYLDSKCAAIDQAITDKTQQIETLKAYKSSLIYEYVTGKKQVAI